MSEPMPPGAHEAAQAAVKVVGEVTSHPANGGSLSSWLTVASVLTAILSAFLVFLPKLRQITNQRLDTLDHERREDMRAMREENKALRDRLDAVEEKASRAEKAASNAESKLSAAVSAITLLKSEVKRLDPSPNNSVIAMIEEMIAAASVGDMGYKAGLARVVAATVRGD